MSDIVRSKGNAFYLSKSRFESFSDGVFAVAITLLVFEIHLPTATGPVTEADQVKALLAIWPQYLAYIASFATIGIMWLNHHAMFRFVDKITHGIVIANLLLLLLISFLPFPTEVLGHFGITRVDVVYYGLTLFAISIGYTLLRGQIIAGNPELPRQHFTTWNLVGVSLYPLATALGYFFPVAGVAMYVLLALFYMLPGNVRGAVLLPEITNGVRR